MTRIHPAAVTDSPDPQRALRHRPRALLLDFGGVVFETSKRPEGRAELARLYGRVLDDAGFEIPHDRLAASIDAGLAALKYWKNASSRRLEPVELTHRQVITDFMVSDLPEGARELLASRARELVRAQNRLISDHHLRPGVRELLTWCREHGVRPGIVSNAHSGASHREILAEHGLADAFGVQIYSDEVGIRKPHPDMLTLAADALGADVGDCWYVGDTQDRDVVAGRRADAGAVIVTRCHHTDSPPFRVHDRADAVMDTPAQLLEILRCTSPNPPRADGLPPRQRTGSRPALLIDHGGVISDARPDADARAGFVDRLAELIRPSVGADCSAEVAEQILRHALAGNRRRKQEQAGHAEVDPVTFWATLGGTGQSARTVALLRSEATGLTADWGLAKSRRTMRQGVAELLNWCAAHQHPVVVVSNTISGDSVRAQLTGHGLTGQITAVVASDEFGTRKPDPGIFRAALAIANADPARTWFLGDKPDNDAAGAAACDIAHRVLVRGGSTDEPDLRRALAEGVATAVVTEPADLLPLISAHLVSAHLER
ncbi:MAG: HAD-IA family hydrolase [Rhodococcus sp. (in: high G+C Gram-positive bacteria)]|uniref:HAD-IA family hydrolase n=1 Tax=Rhodococcus sp. TaxID=1831 RepID=UPI003BB48E35